MPKYPHDCNECTFLTTEDTGHGVADFYVCGSPVASVVIRFGDKESENLSLPYEMAKSVGGVYERARQLYIQRFG